MTAFTSVNDTLVITVEFMELFYLFLNSKSFPNILHMQENMQETFSRNGYLGSVTSNCSHCVYDKEKKMTLLISI